MAKRIKLGRYTITAHRGFLHRPPFRTQLIYRAGHHLIFGLPDIRTLVIAIWIEPKS